MELQVSRSRDVELRRAQRAQHAVQRSPFVSKMAGLGYLQCQLGDSLMLCAKADYVKGARNIVGKKSWKRVGAAMLFMLLASMEALLWNKIVDGNSWRFGVNNGTTDQVEFKLMWGFLFLLPPLLSLAILNFPEPGITVHWLDMEDRTALHIAAMNGSVRVALPAVQVWRRAP